jgi:hypothetical protein
MVTKAESDFRSGASDASIEVMNRALTDRITFMCRDTIKTSYPFAKSSRSLSIDNFARFFGPGGEMDRYFTEYLEPYVERTVDGLKWRADKEITTRLSTNTLRQFERAERIRRAFFAGGGTSPSVEITVAQVDAHPTVQSAILAINDTKSTATGSMPRTLIWPGEGKSTRPATDPAAGPQVLGRRFTGSPWTLMEFWIRASYKREQRGDTCCARPSCWAGATSPMISPSTPSRTPSPCPRSRISNVRRASTRGRAPGFTASIPAFGDFISAGLGEGWRGFADWAEAALGAGARPRARTGRRVSTRRRPVLLDRAGAGRAGAARGVDPVARPHGAALSAGRGAGHGRAAAGAGPDRQFIEAALAALAGWRSADRFDPREAVHRAGPAAGAGPSPPGWPTFWAVNPQPGAAGSAGRTGRDRSRPCHGGAQLLVVRGARRGHAGPAGLSGLAGTGRTGLADRRRT